MNAAPPLPAELAALLRLLDDDTPEIRARVAERIGMCGGDLSEWLATQSRALSKKEQILLSKMLLPSRREALMAEWLVPSGGAQALQEDWESFEALLRLLSDFLHDGLTLRQPLSDALDLLAEEAADQGVSTSRELCGFLFQEGRLSGNREEYYDPRNSDLAWCLAEGKSNPLGICLIFILVGRRLNYEVEGVNFPGHFMCRIFEEGFPIIVDCFGGGQIHLQATLLENPELSVAQRAMIRQYTDLGAILVRLLNNLHQAFEQAERTEDAELVTELLSTLK